VRKQTSHQNAAQNQKTDYSGIFLYQDNELISIFTPAGRLVPDNALWQYEYNLTDHLGNVRAVFAVTQQGTAELRQKTDYYPFGMVMNQSPHTGSSPQNKFLYNGKELRDDVIAGQKLDWYDYGARMYDAAVGRWHVVDPLAEKYAGMNPYNYCVNNPIMFVDPDGRDGMVTGKGTKEDPYVITANYYYQKGSLSETQVKGLEKALSSFNNAVKKGVTEVKNSDGSKSFVKFNLTSQEVDNIDEAIRGDNFTFDNEARVSFGNVVGVSLMEEGSEELGSAHGWGIYLNDNNITAAKKTHSTDEISLVTATFIHEIGHNLGLDHADNTAIMKMLNTTNVTQQIGGQTRTYSDFPKVDKKGIQIFYDRIGKPRVNGLGIIRTKPD